MESRGLKAKQILTILGPISLRRSMFHRPQCGDTRYAGDEELDVVGMTRSPGVRRMMARAGSQSSFKDGCEDLREKHPVENCPFRMLRTIDSRHGGRKASRNGPTSRIGPHLPWKDAVSPGADGEINLGSVNLNRRLTSENGNRRDV